jgi:glucose-1-phosphate adenylyltransferase
VLPVDRKKASAFGLLKIDDSGRVVDFKEKPKGDELESMQVDTTTLGLEAAAARENPYIASMGIYVFKREAMIELLNQQKEHTDFGKEIIPGAIAAGRNVQAHLFMDYWEDIGTIEAFYNANLDLTKHPKAPFSLYEEDAPIYTRPRYLPPTKVLECQVRDSIISDGCIIDRSTVNHSVLGVRVQVSSGCVIEDSLLMGSDFYQTEEERAADLRSGKVPIGIGENTIIRRAIVDKNARIGKHVQIINKEGIQDTTSCEDKGYCICNGIVVVLKGATIPDNTTI